MLFLDSSLQLVRLASKIVSTMFLKVLDLGSGSGRDCYICAALVGERGNVIGIDMTEEQLKVSP